MQATRMVRLTTVTGAFHARVLAARLGADGILTELRGNVDGPYPGMGLVDVYVEAERHDDATALLLADEVDAAFESDDEPMTRAERAPWQLWAVVAALVAVSLATILRAFA